MADATILVIDDDPDIRALLRHVLTEEGYEVREAAGGRSGLALAELKPVDLVILDLMMPDVAGWEVLERIAGRQPVLVLTALSDRRTVQRALDLGAAEVILKTTGPLKLLAAVHSLIQGREGDSSID